MTVIVPLSAQKHTHTPSHTATFFSLEIDGDRDSKANTAESAYTGAL